MVVLRSVLSALEDMWHVVSCSRVPMSRLRLRVAQRLKAAQNTYALLTTFNEVDMSNIIEMRTLYKDLFLQKHGVKLGAPLLAVFSCR